MSQIGTRLRRLPVDTKAALAFFSRLPVPPPAGSFDLRQSAAAWPLAGLILAGLSAVMLLIATALGAPPAIAALVALATITALTGGLHEDGLADTADGFGGGSSREAKLAIMRDSRLGTYGALALIFSVALKATALDAVVVDPHRAALALMGAGTLSRSFAVWHWWSTLPARTDGLALAAGKPDTASLAVSSGIGLLAAAALLWLFGWAATLALLLAFGATALFSRLCQRQIGGHTGDTIGAAQQIAETLLLVGLSISWAPIRA